jgi:hypothetical protein
MLKIMVIICISFLTNISILSQGKIIDKTKANELFGPVLYSIQIQTDELKSYTNKTSGVIMFKILNNDLYILDNKRNTLKPAGFIVNSMETFSVYAVSVVQQLINNGNNSVTYIEKRNDVLTLTNGDFTLEFGVLCPPYCPD